MMDSIYVKQNDQHFKKCMVAQRKEYNKAKRSGNFKDVFIVIYTVVSIIAAWRASDILVAVSFLFSGMVFMISKYLDIHTFERKTLAASIQQYVDVNLYSYILNDEIADWGDIPTRTKITETTIEITEKDINEVKNWYSDYSKLTPIEQVFFCQKENIRWDLELRIEFRNFVFLMVLLVVLILLIITFSTNPSIIKLLCILSWILPLIDYCYSYYSNLQKDIQRVEDLKIKCDKVEQCFFKKDFHVLPFDSVEIQSIRKNVIKIQKCIFNHRKKSTLIPNWFYKITQKQHQFREDSIAMEININK